MVTSLAQALSAGSDPVTFQAGRRSSAALRAELCDCALLPGVVFPVGHPEVESCGAPPARPVPRKLLNLRDGRLLPQSVEFLNSLVHADIRGGQTIEVAKRAEADVVGVPWSHSPAFDQPGVSDRGLENAQALKVQTPVQNGARDGDDVAGLRARNLPNAQLSRRRDGEGSRLGKGVVSPALESDRAAVGFDQLSLYLVRKSEVDLLLENGGNQTFVNARSLRNPHSAQVGHQDREHAV